MCVDLIAGQHKRETYMLDFLLWLFLRSHKNKQTNQPASQSYPNGCYFQIRMELMGRELHYLLKKKLCMNFAINHHIK